MAKLNKTDKKQVYQHENKIFRLQENKKQKILLDEKINHHRKDSLSTGEKYNA